MNEELRCSQAGLAGTSRFEGKLKPIGNGRYTTYYCPAGVLTIGKGHTNAHGRKFKAGDVWTDKEVEDAFQEDMEFSGSIVKKHVKVKLTQGMYDALTDFVFNKGEGAFRGSTLLRRVNARDYDGAGREFLKWIYAKDGNPKSPTYGQKIQMPGLVKRAAWQSQMFLAGHEAVEAQPQLGLFQEPEPIPQETEAPEEKSPVKSRTLQLVGGGLITSIGSIFAQFMDWKVAAVIVTGVLIGLFLLVGRERIRKIVMEGV